MLLFIISYFMTIPVSFIKIKLCFCGNYCIKSLNINVSKNKNKKKTRKPHDKNGMFSSYKGSLQTNPNNVGRAGVQRVEGGREAVEAPV